MLALCLVGAACEADQGPIVDLVPERPANPRGYWRPTWEIRGDLSGKEVSCAEAGAAHMVAHVATDDEGGPAKRARYRAPCDTPGKEAFVALEPGRYRVRVELQSPTGKSLSVTSEGTVIMPRDGKPQTTPSVFKQRDSVVIKARNQR